MNRIIELIEAEIDQINGAAEGDSYWGGVGKIALGVGAAAAAVATGGAILVVAGAIAGAVGVYSGAKEVSGALEDAKKS